MNQNNAYLSTYDKVLRLNLDQNKYGSFAEIGAGQGTADWFFKVSGTTGTVAKTISAYDMELSDHLYGKAKRYVSRDRLLSMLDQEYEALYRNLKEVRGKETTFFAYCNTVRARGFQDFGNCYGWLGVRFQRSSESPPTDVVLHINLLDEKNVDQSDALGILGVNLIDAVFYHIDCVQDFVSALVDGDLRGRVSVNVLSFRGFGCEKHDRCLYALELVTQELTPAAMLTPENEVIKPSDHLYNVPILLLRGAFSPVKNIHLDMLEQAKKAFQKDLNTEDKAATKIICEISTQNLRHSATQISPQVILNRASTLQKLGFLVLISNRPEFYKMTKYLSGHTKKPIGLILGCELMSELFQTSWSESLAGGILESFGKLFQHQTALYVYPYLSRETGKWITVENYCPPSGEELLYQYFREQGKIRGLVAENECCLNVANTQIRAWMKEGNPIWKKYVPEAVHSLVETLKMS